MLTFYCSLYFFFFFRERASHLASFHPIFPKRKKKHEKKKLMKINQKSLNLLCLYRYNVSSIRIKNGKEIENGHSAYTFVHQIHIHIEKNYTRFRRKAKQKQTKQ